MAHSPEISIVVPAHNEERNVPSLCERLASVLEGTSYEVVFVDDGSTDGTCAAVRSERDRRPEVALVSLSRNFGHQAALKAGMDHARGRCVVTMDADLEHPPEVLPQMIAAWRGGADVVSSRRRESKSLPLAKRVTSRVFYAVLNWLSDVRIEPGSADFRLIDRRVVDICRTLPEGDIFWRGMIPWLGFRTATVSYDQGFRTEGVSKYSLVRMARLSLAGITSFSVRPLHLSIYLGASLAGSSFVYLIYALWVKLFTEDSVSGWASMVASVLLIGGIQLLILGVIGVYIGKLFMQAKQRPSYLVQEALPSTIRADSVPKAI